MQFAWGHRIPRLRLAMALVAVCATIIASTDEASPGPFIRSGAARSTSGSDQVDWPKFQFDLANTGFNPLETILSPSNVGTLQQVWQVRAMSSTSPPAIADGVIYQDSSYPSWSLSAYDAETGAKRWQANLASFINISTPAVSGGVVYVGTDSGLVYALDAATGGTVWTAQLDSRVAGSPAVWNGAVYITTTGCGSCTTGYLYALDVTTGTTIWTAPAGPLFTSSQAIADGVVYIGSRDEHLYAFDAASGSLVWSTRLSRANATSWIEVSPAVADGVVYIGVVTSFFFALDAVTGKILWRRKLEGEINAATPAVANGVVYAGTTTGFYALDATTGTPLWTQPFPSSSPAVANGVVYAGSGDQVCALDALSGSQLWCAPVGPVYFRSPVVVNGMVYMGGGLGLPAKLFAFGLPSHRAGH